MNAFTTNRGTLTFSLLIQKLSLLAGLLTAAGIYAIVTGTEHFKINDLYEILKGIKEDSIQSVIFWEVRFPRALLSATIGGALGICGAVLQTLLRNPLAEPFLLGISSGAAIGAYAAILIGFQFSVFGFSAISVLALLGGLLAIAVVYKVARVEGRISPMTLILAGVVVNAMLSSVILFANSVFEADRVMTVMYWLLGHITGLEKPTLILVIGFILSGSLLLMFHARSLNGMVLGEGPAEALGIPAERLKKRLLLITTALTAVAVSLSGLIGFVGIVVPHAVRLFWGADHRLLLPASFLLGGTLLVLADTFARTVIQPAEMPIGVITAVLGGPFFLILLRRSRAYV